jgi:spore coat polysaccharide biosynthesis predicted glycosyltransferase SpsG
MFLCRTEISPKLGFHRLNRCITLAALLKQYGPVQFVLAGDRLGHRLLEERGYAVMFNFKENKQASQKWTSLIFDIHHPDSQAMDMLSWAKEEGIATVQFADFSSEYMDVDVIIDPSFGINNKMKSDGPPLQGPAYAMLHHKYRHFHKVNRKYSRTARRILVALGSSIPYRKLRQVIDQLYRHHFQLKVAAGFYLKKSFRKVLKRCYPGLRFVGKTESLARPFFQSDVACITAGQTLYESAATGTPAVYLARDNNQYLLAKAAEKQGLGVLAGQLTSGAISEIPAKINSLCQNDRMAMGRCGKNLVDGMGAYRIIDFFRNQSIMS